MDVWTASAEAKQKNQAITITGIETIDVRFPTSRSLDGSDAMNADPDYSAAYVILRMTTGSRKCSCR